MKVIIFVLAMIFILNSNVFSQDKKNLIREGTTVYLQNNFENTGFINASESGEINVLYEKIISTRNAGNINEVDRLNNELNEKSGLTSVTGENVPVYDVRYNEEVYDNPLNTTIISRISDEDMLFNEFATVTEQIGPTKGRIWAIYRWKEPNAAYEDPMHITLKYSDNGGTIWNHYITFSFTSNYFTPGNNMDAEFVYNSYLYDRKKIFVVFPIEGSFGQSNMALLSVNADTINAVPVINKYAWAIDNSHTYHSSRMTSDNVNYYTVPYLYFCSAEIYQSSHNTLRTAVCTNPFSANPALTLNPNNYVSVRDGFFYDQFDISYYSNGGDSILLALRLQTDKRILEIYRGGIATMTSGQALFAGNLNVANKTQHLPKVASDGSKNIMIVSCFDYSASDQDVITYSTSNGAIGPYATGYVGNSSEDEEYPQVEGKYYSNGSFYCSAMRSTATTGRVIYRSSSHNL